MKSIARPRLLVKETIEGTWLVYEPGQRPTDGVAVWRYDNGLYVCSVIGHDAWGCDHIKAVLEEAP